MLSQNIKDLHFFSHSPKYEYSFCEFYNKSKNFDFHANRSISTLTLSMQSLVRVQAAVHVPLDY